jgi:PAS domain S-box-containing protein
MSFPLANIHVQGSLLSESAVSPIASRFNWRIDRPRQREIWVRKYLYKYENNDYRKQMSGVLPAAFRELEQAVGLFSQEGVPKDYNPATKQLLGYSEDEFRHLSLTDLIAPNADFDEADVRDYLTSAAAGNNKTFEWQIQRSNGEPR